MSLARKHYRTASIDVVDKIATALPERINTRTVNGRWTNPRFQFANGDEVARWVLRKGPVRLRLRKRDTMRASMTTGVLDMYGEKGARITAAIVGYDTVRGFRVLMPFGPWWGQQGRCWVDLKTIDKFTADGETKLDAVVWTFK